MLIPIALSLYLSGATVHAQSSENALAAFKAKDYVTALNEYKLLAKAGDAKAQEQLGWMFKSGQGSPIDLPQSFLWFQKAAEQGNIRAQAELGWIYKEGRGVEKSDQQSVMWFGKAAESGNASAQYGLGLDFAYGQGVTEDQNQAIEWLEKAAKQGHAKSKDKLAELTANSSTRIEAGQKAPTAMELQQASQRNTASPASGQEFEIKLDGLSVPAASYGKGDHMLIILPGLDFLPGHTSYTGVSNWRWGGYPARTIAGLNAGIKTMAISWSSMESIAAAVKFARANGAKQVSILGHSAGGEKAQQFVNMQPEGEINTIVLLSSNGDQGITLSKTKKFIAWGKGDSKAMWSGKIFDNSKEPKQMVTIDSYSHDLRDLVKINTSLFADIVEVINR